MPTQDGDNAAGTEVVGEFDWSQVDWNNIPASKETLGIITMIMHRMNSDAWSTGMSLTNSYKDSYEKTQRELDLVRARVMNLLRLPYMPNSGMIKEALYPSSFEVEKGIVRVRNPFEELA